MRLHDRSTETDYSFTPTQVMGRDSDTDGWTELPVNLTNQEPPLNLTNQEPAEGETATDVTSNEQLKGSSVNC